LYKLFFLQLRYVSFQIGEYQLDIVKDLSGYSDTSAPDIFWLPILESLRQNFMFRETCSNEMLL